VSKYIRKAVDKENKLQVIIVRMMTWEIII